MSVYIKGMEMPKGCARCPLEHMANDPKIFWCSAIKTEFNGNRTEWAREHKARRKDCPIIPVPDHGGLFDVGQFEKGCFYGYGRDGKVYKLFWDERVFEGAKKFYINPVIPAGKEEQT